jgi:hypothetical protein
MNSKLNKIGDFLQDNKVFLENIAVILIRVVATELKLELILEL